MTDTPLPFDPAVLEAMNAKAVQNQFFTPDHVYIDMSLLKDIPLGVAYLDTLAHRGQPHFETLQADVLKIIHAYQVRRFDTVDALLSPLGYTDASIEGLLNDTLSHDDVFLVSPTTYFFNTLIAHTLRNQNHSGPADKFTKRKLEGSTYSLKPIDVTYYFNTFPLTLSSKLLNDLAPEFGEAFGVNIQFINKDPLLFDDTDWNSWMKNIDCFYLNSLGRFTGGDMVFKKQGEDLAFVGRYIFARKRFETSVMALAAKVDFEQQIQLITSKIDMLCDFTWLPNNDVRLSEDAEVSSEDPTATDQDNGTPS